MDAQSTLQALGDPLPLPGAGDTPRRHARLLELGRRDLSLARILEAHTDALAILAEARRPAREGALYGVWASDGPNSRVIANPLASGRWCLSGLKQYCSGARFCTSSLVTAHHADGIFLFDVSLDHRGVSVQESTWTSPAFSDTATCPVRFDDVVVDPAQRVGDPDWYLTRPGFWHGAIGPAACWAGGACALIDSATRLGRQDPHSLALIGALQSNAWALRAFLDVAGRDIDTDPFDTQADARHRARKVRHLIERTCTEVLDQFGRATGPQLLAYDAWMGRQYQSLALYIRQCHAERDLAPLGEACVSIASRSMSAKKALD